MKRLEGIVSELYIPKTVPQVAVKKDVREDWTYVRPVALSNAIHFTKPSVAEKKERKRSRRVAIALFAFFIFIVALGTIALMDKKEGLSEEDFIMVEHYVSEGDSIWQIVQSINEGRKYDIREYVYITTKNNPHAFARTNAGAKVLSSGVTIEVPQSKEEITQ